jgi:hypothetical protein
LNPIRAGIAKTPEGSDFTSAKQRIDARLEENGKHAGSSRPHATKHPGERERDGWLSPVPVEGDTAVKAKRNRNRRASNKGFLSMEQDDYLRILDWTGRQIRSDKRGAIAKDVAPILDRLGVATDCWVDCVKNFGRWFHRAAGRVALLADEASHAGKRWLQGIGHCQQAFA